VVQDDESSPADRSYNTTTPVSLQPDQFYAPQPRVPNFKPDRPYETSVEPSATTRMLEWCICPSKIQLLNKHSNQSLRTRLRRPVTPRREKKPKAKRGEGKLSGKAAVEKHNYDTDVEASSRTSHSTRATLSSARAAVYQEEGAQAPTATPVKMEDLSKDDFIIA
jgi:hypothetical protein